MNARSCDDRPLRGGEVQALMEPTSSSPVRIRLAMTMPREFLALEGNWLLGASVTVKLRVLFIVGTTHGTGATYCKPNERSRLSLIVPDCRKPLSRW